MAHVLLRNQAGNFVAPDDATFKAAAANAQWDKTFYQILTDQPGKDAWPITGATFIMMHAAQEKPVEGAATLKFFDWAFTNGDGMATELEYVPLPDSVKALVRTSWGNIRDSAGKPIAFK
jgi:phosphate transport system substrate-binding protein